MPIFRLFVSIFALLSVGSLHASAASSSITQSSALIPRIAREFTPENIKKLPAVIAAPICMGLAEAYRDIAERECIPDSASADATTSYLRRKEAYALMFRWYGRVAAIDSPLIWAARSRMMECYLNGEGVIVDIPKAKLFARRLLKDDVDLSSQAIANARLGQMLCLGLGPQGLNWKQYEIGRDHMGAAIKQDVNQYASKLADLYDQCLLAHGEGLVKWLKKDRTVPNPSPEIRELEHLKSEWPTLFRFRDLEELIPKLNKISDRENWSLPLCAQLFNAAGMIMSFNAIIQKHHDNPHFQQVADGLIGCQMFLGAQDFMPYIKYWTLSNQLFEHAQAEKLEATAAALKKLRLLKRDLSIALRAALAYNFVIKTWTGLSDPNMGQRCPGTPMILEVFDGLYEALNHEDARLQDKTWGLYELAKKYYDLYQHAEANRTLYLQRAIHCLNTILAKPHLLAEFEEAPGNFGSVHLITSDLAVELGETAGRFERTMKALRDQWQEEANALPAVALDL